MFTKLCGYIAFVAIIFGAFQLFAGLTVAFGQAPEELLARYVGSGTSGEYIDKGIYKILFGIAFGAISEIGHSLKAA